MFGPKNLNKFRIYVKNALWYCIESTEYREAYNINNYFISFSIALLETVRKP